MSRLNDVRTTMAAAITSAGLACSASIPSVINPPCAFIRPISGNWDLTLPRSSPTDRYALMILIPNTLSQEEAQETLDGYLESSGNIKTAIETANYNGKINYARVIGWRAYGETVLDQYVGVIFDIVTYGP